MRKLVAIIEEAPGYNETLWALWNPTITRVKEETYYRTWSYTKHELDRRTFWAFVYNVDTNEEDAWKAYNEMVDYDLESRGWIREPCKTWEIKFNR